MMIATVPFVAVGFLFSLTAQEADLGRRSGGKKNKKAKDEETADGANPDQSVTSSSPPTPPTNEVVLMEKDGSKGNGLRPETA